MLSISSTAVIQKSFEEIGIKNEKYAQLVMGTLIMEDILAIFMLVILSTISVSQNVSGSELAINLTMMLCYLVVWLILGIYMLPAFLNRVIDLMTDEMLLILSLGVCFGMVLIANFLGFSSELGAFLAGSLLAYNEGHLKKRLAWSSVSQVSYVLFGLSTMNPVGLVGALLHAIAHSLAKDTLFMSAGAIIMKTEKAQVSDLRGIGKQMTVTLACFTVASLGLVGIPPCMGFISKWYLAQGSLAATGVNAALNVIGPVVLLISALLTAGYLFPIVIRGFITGNAGHGHGHDEPAETFTRNDAPKMMLIPLLVLAALSVLVGMFPGALIDLLSKIGTALM